MSKTKPDTLPEFMFPELLLFERKGESGPAWDRARPGFGSGVWGVILWSIWFTFAIRIIDRVDALLQKLIPGPPSSVSAIASYVVIFGTCFGGICAYLWLLRRRIRRSLRLSLIASGVPVCLHCCYDVRGQVEPRCPECGREFDPKLRDLWEYLQARQSEASTGSDHETDGDHEIHEAHEIDSGNVIVVESRPGGAARE